MLVQSTPDKITLLPALPSRWREGSLKDVRVRGGGKADITWKKGQPSEVRLIVDHDARCKVAYGSKVKEVNVRRNRAAVLNGTATYDCSLS